MPRKRLDAAESLPRPRAADWAACKPAWSGETSVTQPRIVCVVPAAPDLTLYHFPSCPYCQRVFKALAALGVSVQDIDVHQSSDAQAEVVQHTGQTAVPVLRIAGEEGDRWMPESTDIVRYLYDRFGDGKRPSMLAMLTPAHKIVGVLAVAWVLWQLFGD